MRRRQLPGPAQLVAFAGLQVEPDLEGVAVAPQVERALVATVVSGHSIL